MVSLVGQTVSHYSILEHLGGGGMGVVYKAHDTRLDRPVALKFLPPSLIADPEAKERFIHEAKAASALQHANICTLHDIDESPNGELFIVMDFYEGETLKSKISRGPIDINEALIHGNCSWNQEDCCEEEKLADKVQNKRLRISPQDDLGTARK